MPDLQIAVHVSGGVAPELFAALVAVERYPALTDKVRSVTVHERTSSTAVTAWEVCFRDGIMKWTETEAIDWDARTLAFDQLEGDFEVFSGAWEGLEHPAGCIVRFTVDFDLGMPTLAPMIDPIAESTLRENVVALVRGVSGRPVEMATATVA